MHKLNTVHEFPVQPMGVQERTDLPLIADEEDPQARPGGQSGTGSIEGRLGGVVAPHHIEGDAKGCHQMPLPVGSDPDRQLAAVVAAGGAHTVGQLGYAAIGASARVHDFEGVVGAATITAGSGMAALGIRHGRLLGKREKRMSGFQVQFQA
jgi:hypothetical protein